MNRSTLHQLLPGSQKGMERWLYCCLEEHYYTCAAGECGGCTVNNETLVIISSHAEMLADTNLDIRFVFLALGKSDLCDVERCWIKAGTTAGGNLRRLEGYRVTFLMLPLLKKEA